MFSEKDRFRKLRFEITSGNELIGSCPFDLNTGYDRIQKHEKVEIPMECKHISVDTILGHLPMIFDAKWQNFCVRKIPMPMPVQAQGS